MIWIITPDHRTHQVRPRGPRSHRRPRCALRPRVCLTTEELISMTGAPQAPTKLTIVGRAERRPRRSTLSPRRPPSRRSVAATHWCATPGSSGSTPTACSRPSRPCRTAASTLVSLTRNMGSIPITDTTGRAKLGKSADVPRSHDRFVELRLLARPLFGDARRLATRLASEYARERYPPSPPLFELPSRCP